MELNAFATKVKTLGCLIRGLTLAVVIVPASLAGTALAVDLNQHGLTGTWYQPAMNGQGILLEVYPNAVAPGIGFLQGSWFTFKQIGYWDYDWEHRWYTFSGSVPAGQSSAIVTVYQNVGGNFNSPPATPATPVGTAVLSFQDCATGTMTYTLDDGIDRHGVIPLVRLMPDVTCSATGESSANADFGHSGNWFDPAASGQGLVFEVNPIAETVFFTWFTYARDGQSQGVSGQRWFTGQGRYVRGTPTATVTLYETWGNSFDSSDSKTWTFNVGTATATFLSCDMASLTFAFTSGSLGPSNSNVGDLGESGTINLSRVGPAPADCGP